MAISVIIIGETGDGKTTSLIVPRNGELTKEYIQNLPKGYDGMDPKTTLFVNCDGKVPPFPAEKVGWIEGKTMRTGSYNVPITAELLIGDPIKRTRGILHKVDEAKHIKSMVIDTINGSMNDKEMAGGMTWDRWYDLAKDYYKLVVLANSLRKDLVVYLFGHPGLYTDIHGNEKKMLLTNGKKLEKIKLESKAPVVLSTVVEGGGNDNKYYFETQKNRSSSKSPIGMFDDYLIPNSLRLVDEKIRQYYGIS